MEKMPWWTSDNVVDGVGFSISALPWAFPGPSPTLRISAVAVCAAGWLTARFVTKSLELGVFVCIVSWLVALGAVMPSLFR